MEKLSTELERHFFAETTPQRVTLNDILTLAGERTFGFLFVLLSLPSALPIPAPGYSVPFGVVMLVLALQLIAGRTKPWLPERFKQYPIELKQVQGVLKAGLPWLRRIEALTRPRLTWVCVGRSGRLIMGVAITLMSISMMIPIPLTNTLPAMGIFITGFGLLDDDGFISLSGLVVCLMGAALTTSVLLFGYTAVRAAIDLLKGAVF
ncbi:exopolysaccharide biosynthesis protein [Leptolyngbya sp. AN02str]|uniref:exopolysaccharide biosynthesis protein n=1 Tax=Leptolyngbya sp. AN02str TaxID=3423363 RepID=UPI003D31372D